MRQPSTVLGMFLRRMILSFGFILFVAFSVYGLRNISNKEVVTPKPRQATSTAVAVVPLVSLSPQDVQLSRVIRMEQSAEPKATTKKASPSQSSEAQSTQGSRDLGHRQGAKQSNRYSAHHVLRAVAKRDDAR